MDGDVGHGNGFWSAMHVWRVEWQLPQSDLAAGVGYLRWWVFVVALCTRDDWPISMRRRLFAPRHHHLCVALTLGRVLRALRVLLLRFFLSG
jgi:hypothetical protein